MSGGRRVGQGGPGTLVWRDDLAIPRPGAGEVLVRVLATGMNMAEGNSCRGRSGGEGRAAGWAGEMTFARTQGFDLCGRVIALGDGVERLVPGARVLCRTHRQDRTPANPIRVVSIGSERDGGLAQYCLVHARDLRDATASPLAAIDFAAMPFAYGTAHNLLSRAHVAVGERVLVTGASGAVGLAAVQLALLRGAEVTAQCSLSKSGPLRALGATILSQDGPPRLSSFDVVIDVVGGERFQDRLQALRPGGRYAASGAVGGPMVKGDLRCIHLNDITAFAATHQPREVFAGLVTIINTARIRPVLATAKPLHDIAQAPADLSAGRYTRHLFLVPTEPHP